MLVSSSSSPQSPSSSDILTFVVAALSTVAAIWSSSPAFSKHSLYSLPICPLLLLHSVGYLRLLVCLTGGGGMWDHWDLCQSPHLNIWLLLQGWDGYEQLGLVGVEEGDDRLTDLEEVRISEVSKYWLWWLAGLGQTNIGVSGDG